MRDFRVSSQGFIFLCVFLALVGLAILAIKADAALAIGPSWFGLDFDRLTSFAYWLPWPPRAAPS